MAEVFISLLPGYSPLAEKPPILQNEAVIPAQPDPTVHTSEQVQAVDTVFTQDHEKLSAVSFYMLWSGAMFLGDMAREHLNRADEEDEDEEQEELPPQE
jgi:hypothetical protein